MVLSMEIGVRLKEAREAKKLSLESLQETTKIQKRYLVAIEQGDFHVLPGKFYARAFIKEYALAVGLNPDELLEEYKSEIPSTEDESMLQYSRIQRSNKENRRERNPSNLSFILIVTVVFLVITIFFSAWFFYQKATSNSNSAPVEGENDDEIVYNTGDDDKDENADNEGQTEDPTEDQDDNEAAKEESDEESSADEPEFSVVEEGSGNSPESILDLKNLDEDVIVNLEASGDTYLEIKGESGETFFTGMVTSDQDMEEIDVGDEERIHFNVGNAPALSIKINDVELKYPVDPEGTVHQKIWVNLNTETE